jgi:hypothetical protein
MVALSGVRDSEVMGLEGLEGLLCERKPHPEVRPIELNSNTSANE